MLRLTAPTVLYTALFAPSPDARGHLAPGPSREARDVRLARLLPHHLPRRRRVVLQVHRRAIVGGNAVDPLSRHAAGRPKPGPDKPGPARQPEQESSAHHLQWWRIAGRSDQVWERKATWAGRDSGGSSRKGGSRRSGSGSRQRLSRRLQGRNHLGQSSCSAYSWLM